ncbi:MAG: hypothetical protein ACBR12_16620 [Microcoleus sp.]
MRLKSWESPRSEGRNSKGKGGSARVRQLKKQQQTLRKKLKAQNHQSGDRQNYTQNNKNKGKETHISFPFVIFASAHSDYQILGFKAPLLRLRSAHRLIGRL